MQLFEHGLEYWRVAKRCRSHREANPAIVPTAIRDMQRLLPTASPAVARRISSFIAANQPKPPRNSPPSDGPRVA
jgi:hypothetical protein